MAAHCGQGEGVDTGFFIYWKSNDGSGLSTEIDFEILGATPQLVYMTVRTKHGDETKPGTGSFSKTTRLIYLRTGDIWQTPKGQEDTWNLAEQSEPLPTTILDYDASANYYTYGFTWLQNSVRFFIYDWTGNKIELWTFPDSALIPTNPAQLYFNLWHNAVDFKTGAQLSIPSANAIAKVDWVEYKSRQDMVENGLSWLSFDQNPDRSWSYRGFENVGITSLAALAFLNRGILVHSDPDVWKALDWIVSNRQPIGSISSIPLGGREENGVYDTSMAILALVAGRSLDYAPSDGTNLNSIIKNAVTYLLESQCVGASLDGYNYQPNDPNYGGWGYPRYDWADLSNTQFALLALTAAKIAGISTVPLSVWQNVAVFAIRCLNDANFNRYWHNANDLGFGYRPGGISYESMTGAGVWSLGLCESAGVSSVAVDGVTVPRAR
jgi:hypothetical protein